MAYGVSLNTSYIVYNLLHRVLHIQCRERPANTGCLSMEQVGCQHNNAMFFHPNFFWS